MAGTAYAEKENSATSDNPISSFNRFLPLQDLEDEANQKYSVERYRAWFEGNARDLLGIDVLKGAVRRPQPITDQQVRLTPSSTGKLVEWEGVVEEVEDRVFRCKLKAIKGTSADFDEFTEFDIDRVAEGDRDLVKPGALFRLVIGVQAISGTRQQFSRLVFRRLPAWNKKSIEEAQAKLETVFGSISWSDGSAS